MKNKFGHILNNMRQYAAANNVPVLSEQGSALLSALVQKHRPLNILEIGTAIGYSALLMHSCQGAAARITTLEKEVARLNVARQFFLEAKVSGQITLLAGEAKKNLPFLEGYFDFVFLDAAKGQYLNCLFQIMDKLAPQAVIVADNVFFRGYVEEKDTAAIPRRFRTIARRLRQYLAFVTTDARFQTEIFAQGDGVAVSYYTRVGEGGETDGGNKTY